MDTSLLAYIWLIIFNYSPHPCNKDFYFFLSLKTLSGNYVDAGITPVGPERRGLSIEQWKNPRCLGYNIGDYTTQWYKDYFIGHYKDPH